MDSITTSNLSFRWADDHLVVTTPKGQYTLDTSETAHLLDMLYTNKDAIFDAEAHIGGLAAWARQHPVQQYVLGSLNPQRKSAASSAPLSLEEGRARRRRERDVTNGE